MPHVVVRNGTLTVDREWARDNWRHWNSPLAITVVAPSVDQFVFNSGGRFEIKGYAQDSLRLTINGSGPAIVSGAADSVACQVNGQASVNLSGLRADSVRVTIAGSGDTSVAARDLVDANIIGHGIVRVLNQPAQVRRRIIGSGQIIGG